jgi:SIR2-like domain
VSRPVTFLEKLEAEALRQMRSQKVGYLLGAGSSFLGGAGYPLADRLWSQIKDRVSEPLKRDIQSKFTQGAQGIEQALDQLDDGGAAESPHRAAVTRAIAEHFVTLTPLLDLHTEFVRRLAARSDGSVRIFSLNYDPLIERAADRAGVRLGDGFSGVETGYFDPAMFEERPYRGRPGRSKGTFTPGQRPIHLLKLHGSLGWYEDGDRRARRQGFAAAIPAGMRPLMVPPQRRKAAETTQEPYAALWSRFRGSLAHREVPLNRLVTIGYGLADHHVNEILRPALARRDFTLIVCAKVLADAVWERWSPERNAIVITEQRCALLGETGPGHPDLWDFARLAKEV